MKFSASVTDDHLTGFEGAMKICCGRFEAGAHVWCGQSGVVNGSEVIGGSCGSPESHVSWDGVHYSEAANHWVANRILSGSYCDPPTPIARACLKH